MFPAHEDGFGAARLHQDSANRHVDWVGLRPGDLVVLEDFKRQKHVGTVEGRTSDGLIIWIRTDLNERRMFHIHDCQSMQLV